MFDEKIRAARTQLAALETDLELLGKTATQISSELHSMQDRLTGLLDDQPIGAPPEPMGRTADSMGMPEGTPYQDQYGAWWIFPYNCDQPEQWEPAIHSATRSVTPAGRFRRRRTVQKVASAPEGTEAPQAKGDGITDDTEALKAGACVSAADTGPPPVPAVVSMKQYISAAVDKDAVDQWLKDSAGYAKDGWYTETDLADIKLTAEKRLKTLEERS